MYRIENHPILHQFDKGQRVSFLLDGKEMEGFAGEPIAIALRNSGVLVHRYTAKRAEPRGIFCAIGRCNDCVMIVDGTPNVRTCVTPLQAGMNVETQYGIQSRGAAENND